VLQSKGITQTGREKRGSLRSFHSAQLQGGRRNDGLANIHHSRVTVMQDKNGNFLWVMDKEKDGDRNKLIHFSFILEKVFRIFVCFCFMNTDFPPPL